MLVGTRTPQSWQVTRVPIGTLQGQRHTARGHSIRFLELSPPLGTVVMAAGRQSNTAWVSMDLRGQGLCPPLLYP